LCRILKTESIFCGNGSNVPAQSRQVQQAYMVINQQSTGTVKHLESLIQSEKFGGVASTDSENATLASGR
jgi:hypothetical protein